METKTLNILKLIAATLATAAASVIAVKASGTVEVSKWLVDTAIAVSALGGAFGIVSSGVRPTDPKPPEAKPVEPPVAPPVAP